MLGEYYQPGLGAHEHVANLTHLRWRNPTSDFDSYTSKQFPGFTQIRDIYADPSIFAKTQEQSDGGFRSIADLYFEAGLDNLGPAPDNAEIAGMERILEHWRDLEHREPTLKIVCPSHYNTERKQFGLFADGCPNLLWELNRARREQLTAKQLLTRNVSEKIVDKDNHLRDALKYLCLSLPAPAGLAFEERLHGMGQQVQHGEISATNQMIRRRKLETEIIRESQPVFFSPRRQRQVQQFQRQRTRDRLWRARSVSNAGSRRPVPVTRPSVSDHRPTWQVR